MKKLNSEETILNTLSKDAHWQVSKKITQYFKCVNTAIYLANIVSWHHYFKKQNKLRPNKSFYTTIAKIEEDTFLNKRTQTKILKKLKEEEIIETEWHGVPAKQYKIINFDKIFKILCTPSKGESDTPSKGESDTPSKGESGFAYINKNKDNNNKDNKVLLHNTNSFPKGKLNKLFKKNPFIKGCIVKWNEHDFTPKIETKKLTNVIKEVSMYIIQLMDGSFHKDKKLDKDWLLKYDIDKRKKLSKKDVLKAIHNSSLFFKKGYWPPDKSKFKLRLNTLLYNEYSQKSLFLQALCNPPGMLQEQIKAIKDEFPKTTNYVIKQFKTTLKQEGNNGGFSEDRDRNKIIYGIRTIKEFIDDIPKETMDTPYFRDRVGTPLNICKEYVHWLSCPKQYEWIERLNAGAFHTDHKIWKQFIKEKEEEFLEEYGHRLS